MAEIFAGRNFRGFRGWLWRKQIHFAGEAIFGQFSLFLRRFGLFVSVLKISREEISRVTNKFTKHFADLLKNREIRENLFPRKFMPLRYMQKDISRIDQYSRRQNIDISGLPKDIHNNELQGKVI